MPIRKTTTDKPKTSAEQVVRDFARFMDSWSNWVGENGGTIQEVVTEVKRDGRGGRRPGAGRPMGAEAKITPKTKRQALTKATATKPVLKKQKLDPDEVYNMGIKDLRSLAEKLELKERRFKKGILDELEEKEYFRGPSNPSTDEIDEDEYDDDEADYEGGEDEDDEGEESGEEGTGSDEGEDGDDEEEITREELEEMTLKELQQLAKENDVPASEWRRLDQEALIDLLMGEDDEDEDDETEDGDDSEEADEEDDEEMEDDDSDGDEDSDEDDSEEDEEPLEITEEELDKMSAQELRDLCKELGIKIPLPISRDAKKLRALIMEQAEDEED